MIRLSDPKWLRLEMWCLAGFHAALGLILAFAPARVVVTPSAVEAFRIMPNVLSIYGARLMWAALFCLAAALIVLLSFRMRIAVQYVAWGVTVFSDGLWSVAFSAPLFVGRGSALGAAIFPALLAWCFFVMVRVAHSSGDECGTGSSS